MKYLIIILVLCVGCSSQARIARWSDNQTRMAMLLPQGSPERTGRLVAADILAHDNDIVFAQLNYPQVTCQVWQIVWETKRHNYPFGTTLANLRGMNRHYHWMDTALYIRTHPITVGEIEIAARESQGRIE